MKPRMLLLAVMMLASHVPAQEGLYAPSVPEDAAMVRLVNVTGEPVTLDVGPVRFRDVAPHGATGYRPLRGDVFVISHAGAREVLTPAARSFVTVVLRADDLLVIADERHTDPARSQLVLYNLTRQPVDFVALEPSATLAEGVDPGSSARRVVNAITLRLGAVADGVILYEESLDLDRGESYAMVVSDSGDGISGFVVQAAVEPE